MADLEAIRRALAGVDAFVDDLRAQGIHVGIGSPPSCVCGRPWPCDGSPDPSGCKTGDPTNVVPFRATVRRSSTERGQP